MKTFLYAALCVVCGTSLGEESSRVEMVRRVMEAHGWDTGDVTFQEVGRHGQPVIIKRSGEVVGYYIDEGVWERRDVKEPVLDGVTKIVFGYDQLGTSDLFQIDDVAEIKIWVAAYQNHTEFERRFACFIPTTKSAGFERKRNEVQFGGACLCSLALRFFAEDKEVLQLKGHIQDNSEIDSGMRNLVIHELAKAKLPAPKLRPSASDEEPLIDPFAEEPPPESKDSDHNGAHQPANAPLAERESGDPGVIKIGMSAAELDKVISDYKCEDISAKIGVKRGYPAGFLDTHDVETRWILIPDASCLSIHLSRLKSEPALRIDSIVKGPAGKGYPGKFEWRGLEKENVEKVSIAR